MSPTSELHYRSCNLCEAMCGIEVELQGRSIKSIRGDKNDPFSKGHICPKALALKDLYDDPDRLTRPQKKTPEGWKEISWDEAFNEVARRLKQTQKQHGKDAVGVYLGNPNVHNLGALLFGVQFLRVLRTKNRYSATSVDQLPHMFVASQMFGHQLFMPIPDIDRTDFWVIMGGNPVVSNGSIMSSPDVKRRLKDIQKRGGQVIVIDPRRTQTAALADQHHFITPGTDVFLLLAVLHIIFRDDLVRLGHLQDCLKGLDEVRTLAQAYPPSLASEKTGIKEENIEQLAHTFAKTESAVWYGRMGVSTQSFGAMCQWLINVINIVTGHFDTPGGLMFTSPAFDLIEAKLAGRGRSGRWTTRKRQLPEFGGELPTSALAEEILTEGEGQIKAMITVAGNPILTTPNGTQLERAFETLDFLVCVDFYLNETTRHADIILPPVSPIEREHYDMIFHHLAIRNTAKYSEAPFPRDKDARHDWEILLALQTRMESRDFLSTVRAKLQKRLLTRLGPAGILDIMLRKGPRGSLNPFGKGLTLKQLKQQPQGIDLGPLESRLPKALIHKDKRIDLAPAPLIEDTHRLKQSTETTSETKFRLIGRRHLRSNNSWLHNSERLVKGKERCTALIHPEDGKGLGLQNGDMVKITSRTGSIQLPVELSEDVMCGVVSVPHGWGHNREGTNWKTAEAHAGVSVNDITDELQIDPCCGNAVLNGIDVTLRSLDSSQQ